jgi:hypothetical protein
MEDFQYLQSATGCSCHCGQRSRIKVLIRVLHKTNANLRYSSNLTNCWPEFDRVSTNFWPVFNFVIFFQPFLTSYDQFLIISDPFSTIYDQFLTIFDQFLIKFWPFSTSFSSNFDPFRPFLTCFYHLSTVLDYFPTNTGKFLITWSGGWSKVPQLLLKSEREGK